MWTPAGLQVDSTQTPWTLRCYRCTNTWTPGILLQNSMDVLLESTWSPSGVHLNLWLSIMTSPAIGYETGRWNRNSFTFQCSAENGSDIEGASAELPLRLPILPSKSSASLDSLGDSSVELLVSSSSPL